MPTPLSEQTVNDADPARPFSSPGRDFVDGGASSQIAHLVGSVFFSNDRKVPGESSRIIGVTAPIHGEGTTTITTLMAIELTRADHFRSLRVDTHTLEMLLPHHLDSFDALWSLRSIASVLGSFRNPQAGRGSKGTMGNRSRLSPQGL